MALLKTTPTEFGVDATYWNIGFINSNFRDKQFANLVLFGYLNEQARRDGKNPLATAQVSGVSFIPDATRPDVYAALKEQDDWKDAVDC